MRGERALDDVAAAISACGLKWGRGRIFDLEAGHVSPTIPTVLLLCQAFSDLLGRDVTVGDLLAGAGRVDVYDRPVPLSTVRDALAGAPVNLPESRVSTTDLLKRDFLDQLAKRSPEEIAPSRKGQLWRIYKQCGEAEERIGRSLGVGGKNSPLLEAMHDLWGKSLSAERDKRAGADASAQAKGRITRQLKSELETYFMENDGND